MIADDYRIESRNTPACAGKTRFKVNLAILEWKHPRVRGEDDAFRAEGLLLPETPPRARGRLCFVHMLCVIDRNTPACAGKTQQRSIRLLTFWKHPRVRGEDFLTLPWITV
jgi:hypothetical protein